LKSADFSSQKYKSTKLFAVTVWEGGVQQIMFGVKTRTWQSWLLAGLNYG